MRFIEDQDPYIYEGVVARGPTKSRRRGADLNDNRPNYLPV